MPSTHDYWDQHLQYQNISSVMLVRRFEKIKRILHCNDNRSSPFDCTDKLYKIGPVIDTLLEYFQLPAPTEYLCVDEQMVPFKGRSKLKQCNPQKSKKWGYKFVFLLPLKVKYLIPEFTRGRFKCVKFNQTFKPRAIL